MAGTPCSQQKLIIALALNKMSILYKAYSQAVYVEIGHFLSMEYRLNLNLYISGGIRGVGTMQIKARFCNSLQVNSKL